MRRLRCVKYSQSTATMELDRNTQECALPTETTGLTSRWKDMARPGQGSDVAHSFWSWRFTTVRPNVIRTISPSRLGCAVVVIVTSAAFVTMLLTLRDSTATNAVILKGPFGTMRGSVRLVDDRSVYAFLGIPFAKPPVETLRFQKPVPISTTAEKVAVNDHSRAQPACIQVGDEEPTSEDCLHLNIWTPSVQCAGPHDSYCAVRTVIFFLHGDFFQIGGNGNPLVDGQYLSALGDLVVVVPNYRLGIMGFLNAKLQTAPGNVGLDDQVLALEWTRQNIRYFGGNASDVVLVGHAAGATSLGYHLYGSSSPFKENLRKVILMSESPFTKYPDPTEDAVEYVHQLGASVSCTNYNIELLLKCLRNVPGGALYEGYKNKKSKAIFYPTHTGILQQSPFILRNRTRVEGLYVLLGHTDDQVASFMHFLQRVYGWTPANVLTYAQYILDFRGFKNSGEVVEHYRSRSSTWFLDMFQEATIVCPLDYYAQFLLESGSHVYRYMIERADTGERLLHEDLRLVFGAALREGSSQAEATLCRMLITIWANFAKTGKIPPVYSKNAGFTITVMPMDEIGYKNSCEFLRPHIFGR